MSLVVYLIMLLLAAILGVLITGVLLMMKGGELNRKYGNRLMVARVTLQGAVVFLIAMLFLVGKR